MGTFKYIDEIFNSKFENIHTVYLAKILSVNEAENTAKIQPLGMRKDAKGNTLKQSVLTKVPICQHVRHWELVKQELSVSVSDSYSGGGSGRITPSTHPVEKNVGHVKVEPLRAGDIVVCVCCETNISEAKRGTNSVVPTGRFSQSDSIIVGLL